MKKFPIIFALLMLAVPFRSAFAQDAVSLTITPPFFEVSLAPGTSWSSSIKVVNTSPAPLPIYASVVDLVGSDDSGHGTFKPVTPGESELGAWIDVSKGPLALAPNKDGEVPFSIHVPDGASPGGHYAAILIGSQPYGAQASGTRMLVSSYISSLIFVRISGNVVERGSIRDFYAEHSVYGAPDMNLVLRFENDGNVHLQPQGVVDIYNMWGRRVAEIPVNQDTSFGNVLPSSTRKFIIPWSKESSLLDLGRFTAVATLAYGEEGRKNVTASTSFYIVPAKELGIALGILLALALFIYFIVRWYVRRTLAQVQGIKASVPAAPAVPVAPAVFHHGTPVVDLRRVQAPVRSPSAPEAPRHMRLVKKIVWIVLLTALILALLQFIFG